MSLKLSHSLPQVVLKAPVNVGPGNSDWGIEFDNELVPFDELEAILHRVMEDCPSLSRWIASAKVVEGYNLGGQRLSLPFPVPVLNLGEPLEIRDCKISPIDFPYVVHYLLVNVDLSKWGKRSCYGDVRARLIKHARDAALVVCE